MGRASRDTARKPKLFRAALDPVGRRLVVGGERAVGVWELDGSYPNPDGRPAPMCDGSPATATSMRATAR